MADTPQNAQWNALKKIVKRLPAHLVYYGSALGAIAIAGSGAEGMVSIVGNIGAGLLGNLIADIAKGEDVIDEDIRHRAEDAIHKSDIANLLTKQDFLQGYARLIQRLDAQKTISQDILDELRTGFSKVASADQVEELKRLILQLMQQPPQTAARKARLFISYARADDGPFVERLYHDLKDEFDVWWDRVSMPNRGLTFLQEIRAAIDWADRLLLVAGPRAFTSDYVRDEWQYAYETYKGINITLRLGDYADLPAQLSGFDAPDFRRDDDYDERLATLKRQLAQPVAPSGRHFGVPAKPVPFLDRPEALDTLRELVIADVDKPTLISAEKRTTAVEGMGGIGKSVLAAAFAHDRKVCFAFPDGIVWLTVGRDAKLYELYRAIGIALDDDQGNYRDEASARQNAQKALAGKKCLLILDDVWELPVGRAFRDLISGTSARLLITTRNQQINDLLNANEYRLKLIGKEQAADYLRSWVGDDPDLKIIADKLGYLFLALKLAGALMKENDLSGAEYLSMFQRVSNMEIADDSLDVSINLGVNAAFAQYDDRKLLYHTFGIFQEDVPVPQQTVLQLWSHLRPDVHPINHLKTLATLVNLCLVERREDKTITLHDLLHSYTRENLEQRGAFADINRSLVVSYIERFGREFTKYDTYGIAFITYYMGGAHMWDEILTMFADSAFFEMKLRTGGVEQTMQSIYEAYEHFAEHNLDNHITQLAEIVLKQLLRDGRIDSSTLTLDQLYIGLVYRSDTRFIEQILEMGADTVVLSKFTPNGSDIELLQSTFLLRLCNVYRRNGDLSRAEQSLRKLIVIFRSRSELAKERSRAEYDLAYICYLRGEMRLSVQYMGESAASALEAGNKDGYLWSSYFQAWLKYLIDEISDTEFEKIQSDVLNEFTMISGTSLNARRWITNIRSYELEIAFDRGDTDAMNATLKLLKDDKWLKQYESSYVLNLHMALFFMTTGEFSLAVKYIEEYIEFHAKMTSIELVKQGEAAARIFYYYGLALKRDGQKERAIDVWRDALNFSDERANHIWKRRISQELENLIS